MRITNSIKQHLVNIGNAKLRSFLAMLGIVVGTASVVTLISSSQLATEHAISEFKTLGTNLISLQISKEEKYIDSGNREVDTKDLPTIKSASDNIEIIAPYITIHGNTYFNGTLIDSEIIAANHALYRIMKLSLDKGRFVKSLDHHETFAVIGNTIAEKLKKLGITNALGSKIRINNYYFTIIGVINPTTRNLFLYADLNRSIIIPIQISSILSSKAHINSLLFRVKEGSNLEQVQHVIQQSIHQINNAYRLYFENPKQITDIISKQKKSFTRLLGFVGAISLLVGAIGVMNIMLISVIERRQEIGIRLAVGARQKDILYMFISESIVLTCLGGITGIILGLAITYFIGRISGWGYQFFATPVTLGFIVSVGSGLISGIYPAYRASRLNPVSTLHSE